MEGPRQSGPSVFGHLRSKANLTKAAQLFAVLLSALALKYHYSNASVNDLRWILSPTAFLVESITGMEFEFESYSGYMSADHTFLIAASCSGVNFMIVAFLVLTFGESWRERTRNVGWFFIPAAMLIAYFVTIAANTARIDIALRTSGAETGISWLGPEELHRVEGIFVYFGFLLLLYVSTEMIRARTSSVEMVRRLPLPLLVYYVTTLGIPIVTGAFREAAFWEHSIFVLVTPLFLVLPFAILFAVRTLCPLRSSS
jgi:exosortase K